MKYYLLVLLIALFSCSRKHIVSFTDKGCLDDHIDQMSGCEDLCDVVRNNFFYNQEDSLYVENHILRYLLVNQYRDCVKRLSREQLISIFGTPSTIDEDGSILYYTNSYNNSTAAIAFGKTPTGYIRTQRNKNGSIDKNPAVGKKSDILQKLKTIESVGPFMPQIDQHFPEHCLDRKRHLALQIFYHRERAYWIVNSLLLEYLQLDRGDPYPCIESFCRSEIEQLFGTIKNHNKEIISFPLYDKQIHRIMKEGDTKEAIPVLQFQLLESGMYRASFGWSDFFD